MSERKRDYPSGAEKRKSKRKREEVIKKVPKISSFFQRQDTVSDLDWKGKYYPTHLFGVRSDKQGNLLISVCQSVRHKKWSPPPRFSQLQVQKSKKDFGHSLLIKLLHEIGLAKILKRIRFKNKCQIVKLVLRKTEVLTNLHKYYFTRR